MTTINRAYVFGATSTRHIESVHATLQAVCHEAQRLANIANKSINIPDWGYSSGFRTLNDQQMMYNDGASSCDGIIRKSAHQYGHAIDYFAYVDGQASYKGADMSIIATLHLQAALNLGVTIRWGGLFTTLNDSPHIELLGVDRDE